MSADVDIDGWLAERGCALAASKARARAALEAAGLTRAGKARMSTEKLARAESALSERFALHCPTPACLAWAQASGKEPLPCEPRSTCGRCGGSDNRRATTEVLEAFQAKGVRKLLVVGGSPAVREELEAQLGRSIELRLVDGTERRTQDKAKNDLEWADLALVWGATELAHKVSTHYTQAQGPLRQKVVLVQKRGIAQLLGAAVEHLRRR